MGSDAHTGFPFAPLRRWPLSSAERSLPSSVLTLAAATGRQPRHLTSGAAFPSSFPHAHTQAEGLFSCTRLTMFLARPSCLPRNSQASVKSGDQRELGVHRSRAEAECGSRQPPFPSLVVFPTTADTGLWSRPFLLRLSDQRAKAK